jgi:hypothetical protein
MDDPASFTHRFATVNGIRRHYVEEGNSARDPPKVSHERILAGVECIEDGRCRSETCRGPIMECQDTTAHITDYLAGSLPIEKLESLLTHASACAACRDKLTAAEETSQLGRIPSVGPDLTGLRRRFNAVLADYQDGLGRRPRHIRPPRCATCSFPGQSCSWICRVRFF